MSGFIGGLRAYFPAFIRVAKNELSGHCPLRRVADIIPNLCIWDRNTGLAICSNASQPSGSPGTGRTATPMPELSVPLAYVMFGVLRYWRINIGQWNPTFMNVLTRKENCQGPDYCVELRLAVINESASLYSRFKIP